MLFHMVNCQRGDFDGGNLRKRKVVRISWYYLCKEAGEDVDHLLLLEMKERDKWGNKTECGT